MFKNLEAACGGRICPETLERFQQAMREYHVFMSDLRNLLAPAPGRQEWDRFTSDTEH